MLAFPALKPSSPEIRWFSGNGSVEHFENHCEVRVGGTLIGRYERKERGVRNTLLVSLASDRRQHQGKLAAAFGVSIETVRLLRRKAEKEGIEAVWSGGVIGRPVKLTPALRSRLEKLFEKGLSCRDAHKRVRRQHPISERLVRRVREEWKAKKFKKEPEPVAPPADDSEESAQLALELSSASDESKRGEQKEVNAQEAADQTSEPQEVIDSDAGASDENEPSEHPEVNAEESPGQNGEPQEAIVSQAAATNLNGDDNELSASEVMGGDHVQHVGSWLLIATVAQLGLHACVARQWGQRSGQKALRIALDGVIAALAIGQQCIEGVRRLATRTAPVLLRADHAPSASWVRRLWHRFADEVGSVALHWSMAGVYLDQARQAIEEPAVFYVDNHMRPYTGKHTVRKGWRMQDKRPRPGVTDYYVHDEDGRPVLRTSVASHDSLTQLLNPIAWLLRQGLGKQQRILLAFDRAGAYPHQMATLRDKDFEFVTYERRPYPVFASTVFDQQVIVGGQTIEVYDRRMKNLGAGRGRVRRIALRMEDGKQVNLLAISEAPTERLIEIMMGDADTHGGRWDQENAFKHGGDRWGNNQLDGRRVVHYDPDTVIPNPARRRLDRALQMARVREGLARRELARQPEGHVRHERAQQNLAEAIAAQTQLEALRPATPTHAPLQETELAERLVYHDHHYKTALDTIRIACANAETDLACELAPHLHKPAEAKKALANLFAAPGRVRVTKSTIRVTLQPAATKDELEAFEHLLAVVNRRNLTLPDDPSRRHLRFQVQSL